MSDLDSGPPLRLVEPNETPCPAWLDLFLRASRSLSFEGWGYSPMPCWACDQGGSGVMIYLHPLGRAYSAYLCLGCHALSVSFCDEDHNGINWDDLLAYPPVGLYSVECLGDSGWPASDDAVAALRRAVETGERAKAAGWEGQPNLRLLPHR
jgi:hypothetical protein